MKVLEQKKIAWGITGAGHFLSSSVELLTTLPMAEIFLSRAAREVLGSYKLFNTLKEKGQTIYFDNHFSAFPVTRLYTGRYKLVVISPVTGNSLAKMSLGIADNLVTNLFAHAGKCRLPVFLLPCDGLADLDSPTPGGKEVRVYLREIDRENIRQMAKWPGVYIASDPTQLAYYIEEFLQNDEQALFKLKSRKF